MDRDEIRYPRELFETFARRKTPGLRFPARYGGRALHWVAECAAMHVDETEKIYDNDDMWRVYDAGE